MLLPSERAAQAQQQLTEQYGPVVVGQINSLTRRLLTLGFVGDFTRLVEGPVVRTFYFRALGDSRYSAVLSKAEEIAGTLGVESVRLERQLSELAIAVPRADRQRIEFDTCLHKMLTSPATAEMALPLLMGASPEGEHLYADLANQPHLLIAGATNSGKSVYTAQLICSLALFRSPAELEFILVDTKNLDLVLFKQLEHVKHVINRVNDLRETLQDLLEEVRRRNETMSGLARNIGEYNALCASSGSKGFKYKVLIIDELADVFMLDEAVTQELPKKDRPLSIAKLVQRISQISRAAGVHLVLATQRPSVDVLPGVIKANFPARVCFKVSSRIDSQVVLDEPGAESLLGMGDYLYKITGSDLTKRAHSAFVSMTNIATIISQQDMIRRQYATNRS